MFALIGLFFAAFLAASPLPMQSEVVFLGLQAAGYDPVGLVIAASLGNILGSGLTFALGWYAEKLRGSRWFPFTPEGLARAKGWFGRWGRWALLLSWAPGGDFIVALAGFMRLDPRVAMGLIAIAKILRYIVVALAGAGMLGLAV